MSTAKTISSAGADIIQLRDKISDKREILKTALSLQKLLRNSDTLFIVNDYLDVAKIVDSDGLHIGQKDISIKSARLILGKDKIIGISCHSLPEAIKAQEEGADYIGLGPVFPTPTKPEYRAIGTKIVAQVKKTIKIPFFVIGDINRFNLRKILMYTDKRVSVCRAILKTRDIRKSVREFLQILN
ncbi:MAG: thiamine phosphate synthase [Candidatus Omnitrophica bacterium]|nr:thiamine phosphate synthase [Candidatus Omnitrophota bacterium]